MKPRKSAQGAFLRRTDSEWQALGVARYDTRKMFVLFPFLGYARLAELGALTADEVALVQSVADGAAVDRRMDRAFARRLLALVPAE